LVVPSSPTQTATTQSSSEDSVDILLVEDNPGDVRLTEEALHSAELEHSLHVSRTGEDALDFLFGGDGFPALDLVLLDLNLPGMDGCDVLESIRTNAALQHLPVVMLTSSSTTEDIRRCYRATANAYVKKPTNPGDFVSTMKAIDQFWIQQAVAP
jgi:two-component system, chemotaxis family, response regulator Rcp1